MAPFATRAWIGLGLGAIVLHFVLHVDSVVYESVGITSAAVILAATAFRRPRNWPAWTVLGVSQLVMGLGDVVYNEVTTAYPGPADVLYLSGDVLLISALVLFTLYSVSGAGLAAHLDALIVAFAIGIAVWPIVFAGSFDSRSVTAAVVGVAYPVADLFVLGVLVRFLFFDDRRTPTFWLLSLGVVLLFVADSAYAIPALQGTYAGQTTWLDAGWLGSYVLFAAAALHPTMGRLVRTREATTSLLSLRRGLVLGGALLAAPIVTIAAELAGRDVAVAPVLVAVSVLLVLVIVRFAVIVRELDRLRLRAESSERKFRHDLRARADRHLRRPRRDHERDEPGVPADARLHRRRVRAHALHRDHGRRRPASRSHERPRRGVRRSVLDRQAIRAQGRPRRGGPRPGGARSRRRARDQPDRGRDRPPRARRPAPAVPEDGGDRQARRRDRARLQQPDDRRDRLQRPVADAARGRRRKPPARRSTRSGIRRCARAT